MSKKQDKQDETRPIATGPDHPPVLHDRRALERELSNLGRLMETKHFESMDEANAFLHELTSKGGRIPAQPSSTPVERAQDIMYEAWDAQGKRRVELAQQALAISPDCADAYVLLAEDTATSLEQEHALYTKAVAAGERALGPQAFKELVGKFWGAMNTRPYMRARLGLASTLWELGQHEAAVAHYQDMLRLNPGDNQGIRYLLLSAFIEMGRNRDAEKLLARYPGEPTAAWLYSTALLAFRREGDSDKARAHMLSALQANPFVPMYLSGALELPQSPPDTIGFGDPTEAQGFVFDFGVSWIKTPGAMEWQATTLDKHPEVINRIAEAARGLIMPPNIDVTMGSVIKDWRKDQEGRPINLETKLQAALNKCPSAWVDGIAANLGYTQKAIKRERVAAIVAHLTNTDKLRGVLAALPAEGRAALALVLTNGWVKYGALTRRFGTDENDGWWWAEEPPTSLLGRVRMAGLLFVGEAGVGGRNYKVGVIPIELRPLLKELLAT
jgi:hypothetical protein